MDLKDNNRKIFIMLNEHAIIMHQQSITLDRIYQHIDPEGTERMYPIEGLCPGGEKTFFSGEKMCPSGEIVRVSPGKEVCPTGVIPGNYVCQKRCL